MNEPAVAVIGLGYIGLPTAVVLSAHGADVIGVDIDEATVDAVNRADLPFVEPDLAEALYDAVRSGRLRAQASVPRAPVYVIAVPTPLGAGRTPDLSFVDAAADAIAPVLVGDELIILESTSPPGTTRHLADRLVGARPDLSTDGSAGRGTIHIAHCPERVLPGRTMVELQSNDRTIGGLTPEATRRAADLYATFCAGELLQTDALTAETSKLVENAFRDVNIAFANEVAGICDHLGVNVWELIDLANHHPRVDVLRPGPGVGGHCIAVDPWFLVYAAPHQARLITTARAVNASRPAEVTRQIIEAVERRRLSAVVLLGLSFKPDTDDLRESPSVEIARSLGEQCPDLTIMVVEPNIDQLPEELAAVPRVQMCDLGSALADAELIVTLVAHREFRAQSPGELGLQPSNVIDVCGIWPELTGKRAT